MFPRYTAEYVYRQNPSSEYTVPDPIKWSYKPRVKQAMVILWYDDNFDCNRQPDCSVKRHVTIINLMHTVLLCGNNSNIAVFYIIFGT